LNHKEHEEHKGEIAKTLNLSLCPLWLKFLHGDQTMIETGATVAVLGTGLMGKPMAANLLRAGFKLKVWNRTRSKAETLESLGATVYDKPSDAVQGARAVVMMLENGAVVTEVLLGAGVLENCQPNTLIIDMSSIAPAIAKDHAELVQAKGCAYIDAPVSGGTVGAENAKLAIMAGGLEQDILESSALFGALGKVTHVGPHGRGQLCKLVNQAIVAVTIGAVSEGLLLAKAGGADPAKVREAIMTGFCQSRILELHGERIVQGNFEPGGTVKNQLKDLRTVLDVAKQLELQLPLTQKVCGLFADLAARGGESYDHSALYLQLEALNQVA
jgi:3-hydroxyisobutyrate dehydrogenase-like beta-hydroxyacid dehydrogenase